MTPADIEKAHQLLRERELIRKGLHLIPTVREIRIEATDAEGEYQHKIRFSVVVTADEAHTLLLLKLEQVEKKLGELGVEQ